MATRKTTQKASVPALKDYTSEEKDNVLKALDRSDGTVSSICRLSGISRSTYYRMRRADPEFGQMMNDLRSELMVDLAEESLMRLVSENNPTASIYLLKTKGKYRGWSEKPILTPDEVRRKREEEAAMDHKVKLMIEQKKRYIKKLLKKEGKYTAELTYQVELTATLMVRYDLVKEEIFSHSHKMVNVEISREGNTRETISPKEDLFLKIQADLQRSLRALGMNTESKERRTDGDDFGEFMKSMQQDDE